MLNKLQQKVTKLQSSLDLQMHMQTELESELKEKNKEIDARGNEVSVLNIKSSDKNDPKLTAPDPGKEGSCLLLCSVSLKGCGSCVIY